MAIQQRRQRRDSIGSKAIDAAKTVERKIEHALTVMWDELPSWQQDNHFILHGYRRATGSFKKCFHSLFYFHNETINIYTHLIGAVCAVSLLPLFTRLPTASTPELLSFTIFLLSATACLALSATYHTIQSHSHSVARFGNQLDYLGIIILIWGSFVPSVYYGFLCHPQLRNIYWGMITVLSLLCAAVTVNPKFRTPKWRPFRAGMFVALGGSAVVPVLHGVVGLYGAVALDQRMGLRWVVAQGLLYVVGAAIYAARVPERWAPGRFDLVGASHQIFHVCVLLAAAAQLRGLVVAFDFAKSMGEGVCDA
ncbi:hemolysin-III related-domain-containing protein [Geopyxis carbonaria]|nr:hemolysin-III related-domain-containing protein [Geopyxis carbonaria]